MEGNKQISSKQIKSSVVTILVGAGILTLPGKIARIQGTDGWIPIILTGIVTIPPIIIINKIFDLYPDKDFFEIGEEVLGKWIFNILLIIFAFHFIITASVVTRHLAELVRAFLLVTTPIEVIIISFIITSTYLARSSINIIGRSNYHIYPIIAGMIVILALIALPQLDFTNLLPVFQSDLTQIPKSVGLTFFSYTGFEVLVFLLPFAEDKEKTLRSSLKGILIVTIIYLIIFMITLALYELKSLQRQTFPTIGFVKEINLPGFFIENLDGFVMAIWILIIFGSMSTQYFSAGKIISHFFNTKSHDLYIIPLLPIIYIISLIPPNIIVLDQQLGVILNYTGIFAMVIFPTIIYSIGYYKVRRMKK